MTKRGRKSLNELATVTPIFSDRRLSAPAGLTEPEKAIWLDVVNDNPANAFTITHAPLLELYCKHIVRARILDTEINNFERELLADYDGLKRYNRLLAMAERESRASASLATKLRITRQSIDARVAAYAWINKPKTKKPWE